MLEPNGPSVEDLPPLADFVALHPRIPAAARYVDTIRRLCPSVSQVGGWTVGVLPLPGSPPRQPTSERPLMFAEGEPANSVPTMLAELQAAGDVTAIELHDDGVATAMRSPGGRVPLYVGVDGDRTVIATRLDLVAAVTASPTIDRLAVSMWAAGVGIAPDNRSMIVGVHHIGRGVTIRVDSGGLVRKRYWTPELEPVRRPEAVTAQARRDRFVQILLDTLDREVPATGTLLSLSGGTDSSSLAYLTANRLGRQLATYSLLPAAVDSRAYELSYIEPLQDELGIAECYFDEMTASSRAHGTLEAPPGWFPILHPVLHWLLRPGAPRPAALLGGELADQIVGSRAGSTAEWAHHATLQQLAIPWRWPRHRATLRALTRRFVGTTSWWEPPAELSSELPAEVRREYVEWRSRWVREGPEVPGRVDLHRQLSADLWLNMNWEALAPRGIRRIVPFHTRAMLDLAYATHPTELLDVRDKRLARTSLRGIVPDRYLDRPGKERWGFEHTHPEPQLPVHIGTALLECGLVDRVPEQLDASRSRLLGALGQIAQVATGADAT